ncbi:MAG: Asp-tRNA(Asn)/Glu-tRNA(Gln) amidotransferase subunit GatA [Paracoccaceae bacterium]|nr:Asp-tRNA(Asn)/Glu-tRNA(Gln) amidotransferase subunit GatA [Paracoccaceae bacterium]
MGELSKLSIAAARDGLNKGNFSAIELTKDCLLESTKSNQLNAFCIITDELAERQATIADQNIAKKINGNLTGIPLGIKDIFCTKGVKTQAASKILTGFTPPYESTITQKLWNSGAVMIGKLNMDEFAMGSSNETSVYGSCINPWKAQNNQKNLTPGGSSGGSGAAVAANLCLAATGTDTGGSIRQPAAFTGIVGLKPTYGRCSRWGIIAFASSLDQAGPMTKTVRDSAILLGEMSGFDSKDSTSVQKEVPNFESYLDKNIKGKKIGIPREYRVDGMPEEIEALWIEGAEKLKSAGAQIVDISLPHTQYALPTYYVIAPAEASSNLARYDGVRFGERASTDNGEGIDEMYKKTRQNGFGAEVKRRIMIGTYALSAGFYDAYYIRAQKVRKLIQNDFVEVFQKGVDVILTPTTPSAAFQLKDGKKKNPLDMYLNDVFTVTANLAGLPAISVPTGKDKVGLPLGLQLIGKPWGEGDLLRIADVLEKESLFERNINKWW